MRLLKRYQFKQMIHSSYARVGHWILIERKKNRLSVTRLGITVSKRYGKSHERNRFKRIVREAFRLCYSTLPVGFDLIVKPRSAAHHAKMPDIQSEFHTLFSALYSNQSS